MVSDSRRLSGGVSRETHETREKGLHHACRLRTQVRTSVRPAVVRKVFAFRRRPSARPCASPRSAQVPGSPGGPVHAGEDAGRAADGGVPRARRPKGNLSSRRWRGTRSCKAWWLHRPNQVPFVCFAGNGFRQVNCIIPIIFQFWWLSLRRNAWVRGCFGFPMTSSGGPCSTITPFAINITRSETWRANSIS